jgi:hypothetical protein
MTEKLPPLDGLVYEVVPNLDDYNAEADEEFNTYREDTLDIEAATVITSRVANSVDRHKVVLDIDLPAKLIPSTTPDHFHLYIDKELEWDAYVELLHALAKAGLVEDGYVGASVGRGHTAARLPWVKKQSKEKVVEL